MLLKHKPYHLLLLSVVILFIAALLTKIFHIEFPSQDSYHAFPFIHFFWLTAITLIVNWVFYLLTLRLLPSKVLMWAHIVVTISSFIFIYAYPHLSSGFSEGPAGMPRRYYDYSELNFFELFSFFSNSIKIAFGVLIIGQMVYFLNLFSGVYLFFRNRT